MFITCVYSDTVVPHATLDRWVASRLTVGTDIPRKRWTSFNARLDPGQHRWADSYLLQTYCSFSHTFRIIYLFRYHFLWFTYNNTLSCYIILWLSLFFCGTVILQRPREIWKGNWPNGSRVCTEVTSRCVECCGMTTSLLHYMSA